MVAAFCLRHYAVMALFGRIRAADVREDREREHDGDELASQGNPYLARRGAVVKSGWRRHHH
jgi:hypothetical protein